jgi:hypothetical protein
MMPVFHPGLNLDVLCLNSSHQTRLGFLSPVLYLYFTISMYGWYEVFLLSVIIVSGSD